MDSCTKKLLNVLLKTERPVRMSGLYVRPSGLLDVGLGTVVCRNSVRSRALFTGL